MQLGFQINPTVFWRSSQPALYCYGNALPLPPSTIPLKSLETEVIEFTNTNITITVTWSPPEEPYGAITLYEVVLTPIPLAEQADPVTDSEAGTILIQSEVST